MRTDPNTQSANPAKRFYEWSGGDGCLSYYDKELKERVPVPLPFEFILLDRMVGIRGWNDATEAGIYSNEVRRSMDEPLTVRSFKMKDPIAAGLYSDIKDKVKAEGGKFCIMLYIAEDQEKDGILSIAHLCLKAQHFLEFEKANKRGLYSHAIRIKEAEERTKGKVKFQVPVFELVDLPPDVDSEAGKLQAEVKAFLDRKTHVTEPEPEALKKPDVQDDDDSDQVPF